MQIKKKELKGEFVKELTVKHQEISDLKVLVKKYFFRGKIKFYLNQKWHNYDYYCPRIVSLIKDFIRGKNTLLESILDIVFNFGFIMARKRNFNPNYNTVFIVNHRDKGANQERLEAVSKFLTNNDFTTKIIDSQWLFDQKINHFSGIFISPFYFISYRFIRLFIYKFHFFSLSSFLTFS